MGFPDNSDFIDAFSPRLAEHVGMTADHFLCDVFENL
jgi:hypothetical protein